VTKSKNPVTPRVTSPIRPRDSGATAREHYRREKARRSGEQRPDSELLAAAKREYLAMLEADAIKGKGGRPRKKPGRPATDTDEQNEGDGSELNDE
jgi:hypothetical protein